MMTMCKRAVDGIILPVAPHTAAPEGSFKYYGLKVKTKSLITWTDYGLAYSAVPSVLDYTTGVVPVTFADQFLDYESFQYTPISDKDRLNGHLCEWKGNPLDTKSLMGNR